MEGAPEGGHQGPRREGGGNSSGGRAAEGGVPLVVAGQLTTRMRHMIRLAVLTVTQQRQDWQRYDPSRQEVTEIC